MNRYEPLETADTDDSIENANRLRNCKKKLRNLEKKPETPGNLVKRKRLKIDIDEYEHKISSCKTKVQPSKNKKQSKSAKVRENKRKRKQADDEYLDEAFQKTQTPEYKARRQAELDAQKRKREAEEKEKREEQRQREEDRQREQQSQERQREKERQRQPVSGKQPIIRQLRDKNAPQDIIDLAKNYDHKVYRKLSLKYHPDKGGTDEEFKLLGMTKDHFTD